MASSDIMVMLRRQEESLENVQEKLAVARQQLDDLTRFLSRHESTSYAFWDLLYMLRTKVGGSGIDEQRVKVFAGYRQALEALLETGKQHGIARDTESQAAWEVKRVLSLRIEDLEDQQRALGNQIEQFRTDLVVARNLEASHVA